MNHIYRKIKEIKGLGFSLQEIESVFDKKNKDIVKWNSLLKQLPNVERVNPVIVGDAVSFNVEINKNITDILKSFNPWRKGPFRIGDIYIDSEWRSNKKWERVSKCINSLKGKTVLDIGSGNGYYGYRMLDEGAKIVVGLEPFILNVFQFLVVSHFSKLNTNIVLPFGIEDLPTNTQAFDTVFSMGVLYHRKDPIEHLNTIMGVLKFGGEVVIETLIIDTQENDVLKGMSRYAKMRNVWNIPSIGLMKKWMKRSGFKNIKLRDVTVTTVEEQRKTEWMTFESLSDFLDPRDSTKTIEGFPAPVRAIFTANK